MEFEFGHINLIAAGMFIMYAFFNKERRFQMILYAVVNLTVAYLT